MAHTPGPWVVGKEDQTELLVLSSSCDFENDPDCFYVCKLFGTGDFEEELANAKLIAAAPELLEALKEVVAISDRKHDAWDRAKLAISKAEGR